MHQIAAIVLITDPAFTEARRWFLSRNGHLRASAADARPTYGATIQCRCARSVEPAGIRPLISYGRTLELPPARPPDTNLVVDEEEAEWTVTAITRISFQDTQASGPQQRAPLAMRQKPGVRRSFDLRGLRR